jgi:4-hydroxy-tetrahydrodipicolinate synthase
VGSGPASAVTIGGVNVAAVTPHRKEGHEADLGATLDLLDYLGDAGVKGVALLGSTGEFLHMSMEVRVRLLQFAGKRSRVPMLAGVGHSTLDGAVSLGLQAVDAGAAALLLMPPYFFRYGQPEIREFYLRFADEIAGAAPIFLYNIPFFTSPMDCDTACDLLRTGQFAGIKDSSGKFDYFSQLQALRPQTPFTLLIGNDVVFTQGRSQGADGVVSGVACAVPELMLGLDDAIQHGLSQKAERLELRLQEFIRWLDKFPAPVGVKEATAARGVKVGPMAVPLGPEKQKEMEAFRHWFKEWLPTVQREAKE